MAQLKYLSTRLVRGWSHLERQRGGIGLRGPGETQLETDRRLIAKRVRRLNDQLVRFSDQCRNRRKSRKKRGAYNVSLVGYTNSGSQHCSMFLQKRMCMLQINYLQRLIRLQEEFFRGSKLFRSF